MLERAAHELAGGLVLTALQQQPRVVAEVVGVIGVGVEGALVVLLGEVVLAANICEEEGVVAEVGDDQRISTIFVPMASAAQVRSAV